METINYCGSELCKHRDNLRGSGLVSYSLRAGLNTSYCVLLRSQHPSCLREDTEEAELPAYCATQVSGQENLYFKQASVLILKQEWSIV